MAVLGQAVVLAEPGVLPVVLVGEYRVVRLEHESPVLPLGVVGTGARDVTVQENANSIEPPLSDRTRGSYRIVPKLQWLSGTTFAPQALPSTVLVAVATRSMA